MEKLFETIEMRKFLIYGWNMNFDESYNCIYKALVSCNLHETGSFITNNKEGILLLSPTESKYIVSFELADRNVNRELLINTFRNASEMLSDNTTNADENETVQVDFAVFFEGDIDEFSLEIKSSVSKYKCQGNLILLIQV